MADVIYTKPTIEDLKKQVKEHSYCYVRYDEDEEPILLDLFSMSAIVQLHSKLDRIDLKEKVERMVSKDVVSLQRLLEFCFRR